jgi:hypothetical protein
MSTNEGNKINNDEFLEVQLHINELNCTEPIQNSYANGVNNMNEITLNNAELKIASKCKKKYNCELCDFITNNHYNHEKHKLSNKHKNNVLIQAKLNATMKHTCKCGKIYRGLSGLWKHKKKCAYETNNYSNNIESNDESNDESPDNQNTVISTNESIHKTSNPNVNAIAPTMDADMLKVFMTVINQNQEFKEMIIEQQKQLLECAKAGKTVNNFNLNVYLNETCKNAINMLDYVNSLQLDLTDLEETGKLGYTNGMSRIFINGLKDMDVHMRPIHCSDLKREVLYIKENDVWEKDNENRDKIKKALRMIEKKNIMLIPVWIKAHPNCVISSNRENTPYLKMVMQSTGGENPAETADMAKIITNIAKAVVINK